jgi:dimethylaniline monooxygenase (N-oxide forming)
MAARGVKTVAVIGAGASGLTAVKACMEEGLVPTCFEKRDCVGGLWSYTNAVDCVCVHRCTISNTSKEMSCFSDFPMPKEYPVYLPNKLILKYLQSYAKEFGILERIRFKTEVIKVHECDGQWVVSYRFLKDDLSFLTVEEAFDFVMICNGLQYAGHIPPFPGANRFKGTQIHSNEYREWSPFVDKTVLVVGIGNSACDIAMDLSSHANQVYLSTRNGTWLVERLTTSGYPSDMDSFTRAKASIPSVFRDIAIRAILGPRSLVAGARLGTAPCNSILDSSVTVCDGLHSCISTGRIQVVAEIKELFETSALLADGKSLQGIDAIIYSTGFETSFPFLKDANIHPGDLYKSVFPVDSPGSMAFLGYIRVRGSVFPVVELQARWVAGVFNGRCKLPSSERMHDDVQKRYRDVARCRPSKYRQFAITV